MKLEPVGLSISQWDFLLALTSSFPKPASFYFFRVSPLVWVIGSATLAMVLPHLLILASMVKRLMRVIQGMMQMALALRNHFSSYGLDWFSLGAVSSIMWAFGVVSSHVNCEVYCKMQLAMCAPFLPCKGVRVLWQFSCFIFNDMFVIC